MLVWSNCHSLTFLQKSVSWLFVDNFELINAFLWWSLPLSTYVRKTMQNTRLMHFAEPKEPSPMDLTSRTQPACQKLDMEPIHFHCVLTLQPHNVFSNPHWIMFILRVSCLLHDRTYCELEQCLFFWKSKQVDPWLLPYCHNPQHQKHYLRKNIEILLWVL